MTRAGKIWILALAWFIARAIASPAYADMLREKADAYLEFFLAHHAPGAGGVVNEVEFADESRTEAVCLRGVGD
ncbi:MAG: hypothetical protein KJ042_02280, partial [Deltaproteobacteria bacterium]|nr:hypothetical protein [Deltaproteobacteria bacterium]